MRTRLLAAMFLTVLAWPSLVAGQTNKPHHLIYENAIRKFEAQDHTNPPPKDAVLFIGSSSIVKWTNAPAQFPEYRIINRGFGGSYLGDSVAFADRIAIPYHPKTVVLYAGDNDLAGGLPPEKVFGDFKAFVKKIHDARPETRIIYIAIKPSPSREKLRDQILTANKLIREFIEKDEKLAYLDVHTAMLTAEGKTRPELFVKDMLHMNAEGYKLWAGLLKPVLHRLDPPKGR